MEKKVCKDSKQLYIEYERDENACILLNDHLSKKDMSMYKQYAEMFCVCIKYTIKNYNSSRRFSTSC